MGAMGGGSPLPVPVAKPGPGNTLGRGSYAWSGPASRPWANPPKVGYWLDYELGLLVILVILVILVRPSVRLLVILARLSVRLAIVARLLLALLPDLSDFLGRLYYFHVAVRMTTCFFSRIRPPEELEVANY